MLRELPMLSNGPIDAARHAADGLEWAHWSCQNMLVITLSGPNVVA